MFRPYLTASLLLSPAAALAQGAPPPDAAADPSASAIIVTATRAPVSIDRVAASVTVLDKAAIDRAQDVSVADLLQRTPGVTVARNGGYGTVASVFIRGAESYQTVVVIDGVKLNDPASTAGGYDFGGLLVGDAARIEVLRGPQSILWGSQAIGGVVNIVTPLAEKPLEASLDLETGSRQTASARAALGGHDGPLTWRLGAQAFTTDGISAIAPAFGGHERDGYASGGLSGRAVLELADGVSADVRGFYQSSRIDMDGFSGDTPEYTLARTFIGYAGLNVDLFGGRLRNRIGYGYTNSDRDNYDPTLAAPLTFTSTGRNERIEYQGSLAIAKGWDAVFGVEHEHARFRSASPPYSSDHGQADLTGVYGQVQGEILTGLTLSGGLRGDHHERYGGHMLASGGVVWALPTGTVLRASYGEGFKAPSLYQLFSEYGNAGLAPERAHGWEAGAEQRLGGGAFTLGATWFERWTKDQIIFASCIAPTSDPLCVTPGTGADRFGYYANIARARARGIEANAAAKLGGLSLAGNYSWTEAQDRSPGATFGNWLPRRPRHAANASASYDWGAGVTTGVAVRWSGKSYDDAANSQRLAPYALVDLRAEWALSDTVRLFARAENLLNKEYATAYRYGTLGRSVYAGVRGRF